MNNEYFKSLLEAQYKYINKTFELFPEIEKRLSYYCKKETGIKTESAPFIQWKIAVIELAEDKLKSEL